MSAQQQQKITRLVVDKLGELTAMGRPALIVCSPQIRAMVRRMIEPVVPQAAVLGINEIVSDVSLECVAMVGLNG
jgi:flagellar biosynthesis component FlhA